MSDSFADRMKAYKKKLTAMQNNFLLNSNAGQNLNAIQNILNRITELLKRIDIILKHHEEEAQRLRPRPGQSDEEAMKKMQEEDDRRRLEEEKRRRKAEEEERAIKQAIAELEKQAKLEEDIVVANAALVAAEAALAQHEAILQAQQQELEAQTKKINVVDVTIAGIIASQTKVGEMFKSLQLKMGSLKRELEEITEQMVVPDTKPAAVDSSVLSEQSESLNASLQAAALQLQQTEFEQTQLGAQLTSLRAESSLLSETVSTLKDAMAVEEEKTSGLLGDKIDAMGVVAGLKAELDKSKEVLAESKVVGLARQALSMKPQPETEADRRRKEEELLEKAKKLGQTPTLHPPGMK